MAKFYTQLDDSLKEFIDQQHIFFTGSAPATGRINISPKGLDCLQILNNNSVAYLDLTGSGNETSAHILENQRLTLMFCSFSAQPLILRLYGKGHVLLPNDKRWNSMINRFPHYPGIRQIIELNIDSVQTSCGFGVPSYDFKGQRETLPIWAQKKGPDGIVNYIKEKNSESIDGHTTHLANNKHPTSDNE